MGKSIKYFLKFLDKNKNIIHNMKHGSGKTNKIKNVIHNDESVDFFIMPCATKPEPSVSCKKPSQSGHNYFIMNDGWISLHRKIFDWYGFNDPERLSLWVTLLLLASHKEKEFIFNGEKVCLEKGQFVTGRAKLSEITGINESKIQRFLKEFEEMSQIKQQMNNRSRLITIINYSCYQEVNSECTASEQRVNTINNENKLNKDDILSNINIKSKKSNMTKVNKIQDNIFKKPTIEEVKQYCLERKNSVSWVKWFNYYEANGWMVGRNKMKNWKAAVRTWEGNNFNSAYKEQPASIQQPVYKHPEKPSDEDRERLVKMIKETIKSF